MATTGAGSPYVVGTDNITTYPTTSLALANRVDAVESGAAAALTSGLASKTDLAMTQNEQTGTTYSFALADASKLLTTSNASPVSVTVTKQATVTWVTGTQLRIMNLGAGVTTLVADTGVTINGNVALKQYQGGTLIRTASDVWLFVPTASGSGMDLITPTSVAGSGVTLSGGQINIAAATTISVNGCFSATYDTYRIVLYMTTAGTGNYIMRLRVAASDNSTSNYNNQRLSAVGTSVAATRTQSQTSWLGLGAVAGLAAFQIDVHRPFLAATTTALCAMGRGTDSNIDMDNWFMGHNTATSFDGFTIEPGSAATGTMRVYGLRNS